MSYVLVLVVFILGFSSVVGAVLQRVWVAAPGTPAAEWQEAVALGAGLVGLFLWVGLFERRSIASLGFRRPRRGVLTLIGGLVIGIVLNAVPTVFLWAIGGYQLVSPPAGSTAGVAAVPMLLLVVVAVLVQSGTEETLTR
ncbi:MAG TPA: hypothetical protein VFR88_11030, partial [Microlunatus sp.]|nr:hypothetical protein [Microlunatus sp.]